MAQAGLDNYYYGTRTFSEAAEEGRLVKATANALEVELVDTAGDKADGIVANANALADQSGSVFLPGAQARVRLGADLSRGALFVGGTDGRAVAASGAGTLAEGRLLEAGSTGDLVVCEFIPIRIHS